MRSFVTVVGAILIAVGIFAAIHISDIGWTEATLGGYDPWSPFVFALGSASAPAVVALIWASLQKLIVRSSRFLTVWLVVFAISAALFAAASFSAGRYQAAQGRVQATPTMQAQAQTVQEVSIHSAGLCPISANFVTVPEVTETNIQVGVSEVKSTTVQSIVDGAVISIECTEAITDAFFPGMGEHDILANYAEFWSIQPIDNGSGGITQQSSPVPHLMLEGTKDAAGRSVLYSYRLFRFSTNFAVVMTGVPEGVSDLSDVETFLSSLKIEAGVDDTEDFAAEFNEGAKTAARQSHMAACVPTIQASDEAQRIDMTEEEVTAFCSCTGMRTFDEFTRSEIRQLATGSNSVLNERRAAIQTDCFLEAIE